MVDYGAALAAAVAAAREAGALLRQEFHRPGGPRGGGDKCPADNEAEAIIRTRLGNGFPDWGMRGEELPADDRLPAEAAEDAHTWLIDPNDGTAAMLAGLRGAAVSIGLVRGGLPVLGVVYAYVHPDDDGDLIAWAEGCGPLTRNGAPVGHTLAGTLDTSTLVIVSQHADRNSLANARLVAPGRFLALPSIAYRLALVAVGDADAAVSLQGAADYDYAAGHALLRAAGGTLVGKDGTEIVYDPRRQTDCGGRCFAGAPAVAAALAGRDWSPVFVRSTEPLPPLALATAVAGQGIADAGRLGRAQGCLLGQLAGDSLGSLVEFQSAEQIARRYPQGVGDLADGGTWQTLAGQPTDDSELALALARTLVAQEDFDAEAVARTYAWWFDSRPFDIGGTTRTALAAAA